MKKGTGCCPVPFGSHCFIAFSTEISQVRTEHPDWTD